MRWIVALALAACGTEVPPCEHDPTPGDDRLLLFTRTRGYRHEAISAGCSVLPDSLAGIGVEVTEDPADFNPANLARFRAVFFLYTSGNDLLDGDGKAAFEDFIRAGGGWIGIHSASATEDAWPFYRELVVQHFTNHADIQTATMTIEDRGHPATALLPDGPWVAGDEWYNFPASPRGAPGVRILASVDEASYRGGTQGADHPLVWSHENLGGRALYTALGHVPARWDDPVFLAHIDGAVRWAMRLAD
ncbi:MAG: ThuA domain-containing protein [Kofleriaceae bacterium]